MINFLLRNPIVLAIIILSIAFSGYYFIAQNNNLSTKSESTLQRPAPTRKLYSNYKIEKLDNNFSKVISNDLNFEITIPSDWRVSEGWSFDATTPETEYVSVEIFSSEKTANLILAIRIGELESGDIKSMIEEDFKAPEVVIIRQINKTTIGNSEGYDIYWKYNFGSNCHCYDYYTQDKNRYINLSYFYPFSGTKLTYREKQEAEKVLSTFKLLTK